MKHIPTIAGALLGLLFVVFGANFFLNFIPMPNDPSPADAPHKPATRQEKKVGEIPEVAKTFTRYDAAYPFMNEKGVIIGETTIGGRVVYRRQG